MTTRIEWDDLWMKVASLMSKRSTCCKYQIGAVLAINNRCIATGYNGVASGEEHCITHFEKIHTRGIPMGDPEFRTSHRAWSMGRELHAEANAINQVQTRNLVGSVLYTTFSPCDECALLIKNAGISRVVYAWLYKESGLRLLEEWGVRCDHLRGFLG